MTTDNDWVEFVGDAIADQTIGSDQLTLERVGESLLRVTLNGDSFECEIGESIDSSDEIQMQSIVSAESGAGMVQLRWPISSKGAQMTPDEARAHALRLLETAEAAMSDAALMQLAKEKLEIPIEEAAKLLIELRRFRGDSTREDWRG